MTKKINIDYIRFLAAFMIVAIHIYPFTSISGELDYLFTRILFRIAVPIFLMITGYFVFPKAIQKVEVLKNYTKKIMKIYGISILLYLPINLYKGDFQNFSFLNFLKDILLDGTFYHLWYFPALILGLWIAYIGIKLFDKKAIILFLILYMVGIFGDSYYGIIEGIPAIQGFYNILFHLFDYTRNGFFYVPVFLFIGYFIFEQRKKKSDFYFFVVFLLFMAMEGILLCLFEIPRHNSMYFFLLPVSYFLGKIMLLGERNSNKYCRNIATWLYILHPMFIVVIRLFAKVLHLETVMVENSFIFYLLVVMSSLIFIITAFKLGEKIKVYKRKKQELIS